MKGGQHGGKRFLLLPDEQPWFGLRLHSPHIRRFDKNAVLCSVNFYWDPLWSSSCCSCQSRVSAIWHRCNTWNYTTWCYAVGFVLLITWNPPPRLHSHRIRRCIKSQRICVVCESVKDKMGLMSDKSLRRWSWTSRQHSYLLVRFKITVHYDTKVDDYDFYTQIKGRSQVDECGITGPTGSKHHDLSENVAPTWPWHPFDPL